MILLELIGLLLVETGCCFVRAKMPVWIGIIAAYLALITFFGATPFYLFIPYWIIFIIVIVFSVETSLRIKYFSRNIFEYFKEALPPISATEREAIDAGDTWWEADLFQGQPKWRKLHSLKTAELSAEEQAFLDNQVETVCGMINDWQIVHQDHDMSPAVWEYLKKEKFFGLVIEKKYGGLEFSAFAHSSIVAKIASRSLSAAINTMVPNSLGPGELLHRYGTEKQKEYYLPRLARGEEIPCFGLTSLEAGSDAGAMIDEGIVCRQEVDGKQVLGIKLNFSKRYITLAPVATLIGLAFKLYDPDKLLGTQKNLGITVALIAAHTPGITIGKRHFPMGLAFMNGPIQGHNVFISFDNIIGGQEYIGQGWRMLMECLSIGRSISLPALSTAAGMLSYRSTGAYARLRQQFRMSIGKFEGIVESMATIAAHTYTLKATRKMTCAAVDSGCKPSVASAIAKYHATEMARDSLNCALDIHAGRAVQAGPSNYLASPYLGVPVAITVEGANILTRNLIIFGQGAIRCHPYILSEMQAVEEHDVARFDSLLVNHISYAASNVARTLAFGLTNARFIKVPPHNHVEKYYQQLTRMSAALAMTADIAMLVLGGNLKRKESLSARLGDVLSALYLSSAILKLHHDQSQPSDELLHVQLALEQQLAAIQKAFNEFFDNFPVRWLGCLLRFIVFPYGRVYKGASYNLKERVAMQMMVPGKLRDRLSNLCYIGDAEQPQAILDHALELQIKTDNLRAKLKEAIKAGHVAAVSDPELQIKNALVADVITAAEANLLHECERYRIKALAVDEFPANYFKG